MTASIDSLLSPNGLAPHSALLSPREADERREPGAERRRAQVDEVVVEIVADGDDDGGADAGPRAAPGEAFGRGRAVRIVVPGDDEACDAGRRRERAEAAGGERSRCGELRDGGDHRQHGLDAFADEQRRAVGGMAESHSEAVDAAERRCHVNHRVTSLWAPTPEIMQRSSLAATVSSRRRGIGGVFGGRPDGVGR